MTTSGTTTSGTTTGSGFYYPTEYHKWWDRYYYGDWDYYHHCYYDKGRNYRVYENSYYRPVGEVHATYTVPKGPVDTGN